MWVDFIDSFLFTLLYPITLLLAVITGYFISRKFYVVKNKEWKSSGIESSVIAIFSLLLSFTFLSSNNSMKDRSRLLHETSDAVANLRRESLFMNDDIKQATKNYLIGYLAVLSDFKKHYEVGKEKLIKEVEDVNGTYLSFLTSKSKLSSDDKQEALTLLPIFCDLNTHFYRIVYSYNERTPHLIIILLLVSSWLIGVLVGFMNGFHQQRHYLVPFIFVVIVTLCVQSIRDLDNPQNGTIQPVFDDFQNQYQSLLHSTR